MEQFAMFAYISGISMLIDIIVIFYMLNYKANNVILFKTQGKMCNYIVFRTDYGNAVSMYRVWL